PRLRFALLTDFADAPSEQMPEDDEYLQDALQRVRELNAKYAAGGRDRFFLFHRRRVWNPVQGCWMGWERKRGKLAEFNRLLRGDRGTSYAWISGDPGDLASVRFVITLDADTQLPRESAPRLVGTIAHPLNRPHFDPEQRRVVAGYGILQPRVSYHLMAATRSRFAAILASSAGIDPYATAVSDVYMDLFGIGSYTGKGIYDVDAFEAATGHTFPENHILSHDLIEGNFARCGLVSDIELFDDFPARYHAYARREHRWVRGDWQLLPWLGPKVPTPAGPRPNPLPLLERWKLLDNLRRSLVPPALLVLLVLAWTVLPGSPWLWTAAALAVPALPLGQWLLGALIGCGRSRSLARLREVPEVVPATLAQSALGVIFLAEQARLLVDAIARTLVRLCLSRRNLLEWETAATTERRLGTDHRSFWQTMWPASVLALGLGLLVLWVRPAAMGAAMPVLAAWFLSPVVAYWISQPRPLAERPLTEPERRALRRVARKTWHFFETFVGPEDHWLPPDNFQEDPDARVAHRTSPTNQGLLLLSTLAAHDLGYLGLRDLLGRLEATFDTLEGLERHQGHFFNWYDTKTLRPLPPLYISTVDSGNLLGSLLVLKQGLREKAAQPNLEISPSVSGLLDTLDLIAEAAMALQPELAPDALAPLGQSLGALRRSLAEGPDHPVALGGWLARLDGMAQEVLGHVEALAGQLGRPLEALATWAERLASRIRGWREEVAVLAPWLALLPEIPIGPDAPAEAQARWSSLVEELALPGGIERFVARTDSLLAELAALEGLLPESSRAPLRGLTEALRRSAAPEWRERLRRLDERAGALAEAMDFRFLYRADRHLFAIGCNLALGRLDEASYDLLASEASLTSLLAVARGDAPRRHWLQLGRPY
ncbi:MAG: glycosyl transferase family 36, partial [Isosphaeraceae bacterium]|nr:glycosyl transferase family 36 [Isosphaeraceae bacterium]